MKFQCQLAVALVATACAAAVCADSSAAAASDHAPADTADRAYPAAFPKGHYGSLNQLPDWGGVWVLNFSRGVRREPPALKGKYLADYQNWTREVKATQGNVPHEGSYCRPPGMPGIMGVGQYPVEFLFTPGRVTMHFEAWMQWRNVFTDGRKHPDPDDLDATFYGDSIGHWEGGTLVVDTIGIKTATQLGMGMKHSDQMHIVEHIHLSKDDPNTLIDEMTVEDPVALEKPWQTSFSYHRARDQNLLEFICEENNRNPVNAQGQTGFE